VLLLAIVLILSRNVHVKQDADPAPCPFCGSSAILLIGGSLIYLYYRCGDCLELWTVTASAPIIRRYKPIPASVNQTIH
jgi:hypothetical protein